MNNRRLKEIRDTVEAHKQKSPKCAGVIIELLDYIDELKNPQNPEQASLLQQKARLWFKRRDGTPFDKSELKAIKEASLRNITETELTYLDWWYSLPDDEAFQKYGNGRRKTIASLFNNIGMEILKAEQAYSKSKPIQKRIQPTINPEAYLLWLDSQDFGDRMKPEWRDINTAPQTLLDAFFENNK